MTEMKMSAKRDIFAALCLLSSGRDRKVQEGLDRMDNLFENVQAEESVIGLMLNHETYWKLIPQITEEDLSSPEYKLIHRAMRQLYIEKRPIDFVTVSGELRKFAPEGGLAMLNEAMLRAGNNAFLAEYHLQEHMRMIREAAMRRKLLSALQEARRQLVETNEDTASVLDRTRQSLRDLVTTGHSWETMTEVLTAAMDQIERRAKGEDKGFPSGVVSLDRRTLGFHRGELTIIGARPAVGKSAFAAQIALESARKGYKVGICSREMTDEQYGTRIIAKESDVMSDHLRTGRLESDEWRTIAETMSMVSQYPVTFMFTTRYIEDLRMEVQKKVDAGEMDMLVVDYTQLMQTRQKFDQDYQRIGYVSKMLKDMTTDFNISVIALAQVGRSTENEMPTLADLRGSGDLEQDADNVLFLHRPKDAKDKFILSQDRELFERIQGGSMQYIVVNIAKQRQGDIGSVAVIFDPGRMRYLAIEREE